MNLTERAIRHVLAPAGAPGDKEAFVLSVDPTADEELAMAAVAPRLAWPICVVKGAGLLSDSSSTALNVELISPCSRPALTNLYSRAAIFALPTCQPRVAVSAVEAAMAGCALVLEDRPNVRKDWDEVALFVPPNDREMLYDTIATLIEEPAFRCWLAVRARMRAAEFPAVHIRPAYFDDDGVKPGHWHHRRRRKGSGASGACRMDGMGKAY